jgi:hypothetical protein
MIAEHTKFADYLDGTTLRTMFRDGRAAFLVFHTVVQDLPDHPTEPMGDRADGLCMPKPGDESAINDREDGPFGFHGRVGGLRTHRSWRLPFVHPRHRVEHHVRRSKFHSASRRRVSGATRDVCRFYGLRTRRSPPRTARRHLRTQLGRRDDQHRHQAADQHARDERSAHPPAATIRCAPKAPSAAR